MEEKETKEIEKKESKKENQLNKKISREHILIVAISLLVLLDQIIKIIAIKNNGQIMIQNVLKITIVNNAGGAFGVGQDNLFMFIITNIIVLGIILKLILTQKNNIDNKTIIALGLILSGGISNVIDRIFRKAVVDYLDFSELINFPKFNLSDIFIVTGWILFALFFAIYSSREIKKIKQTKQVKSKIK